MWRAALDPARVVVAVPAASASTCEELAAEVDEVVCATTPSPFHAVGASYWDFSQTTDEEVVQLLRAASRARPNGAWEWGDVPETYPRRTRTPCRVPTGFAG